VREKCLPNTELEFVQQIHDQHIRGIEISSKLFDKGVLMKEDEVSLPEEFR